jgi:hypothetical protein
MSDAINSSKAPEPVGHYPHARQVGNLVFLSGVGAFLLTISKLSVTVFLKTFDRFWKKQAVSGLILSM